MKNFIIKDPGTNTGKEYIDDDGNNVESPENAMLFENKKKAEEWINANNASNWAWICEQEDQFAVSAKFCGLWGCYVSTPFYGTKKGTPKK